MRHIGENIKRIRKAKKLTISDLAGEQISRGMISLIENGKTQPSIERLQYLAKQLNVQLSDLLSNYTKSELQIILHQAISLKEAGEIEKVKVLIAPLLDQMDNSLEAAHLFKLYGELCSPMEVWALDKSIDIYERNGLLEEALTSRLLIVRKHIAAHSFAQAIDQLEELPSTTSSRLTIECGMLKAISYEALGDVAKALSLVEEALQLSRTSLELELYYELLKLKALFHYGVGDHESARSIINTANTFVQTVQNERLLAEHGILFIHLEEFYEDNEEIAAELADEYVKYMLLDSPLSPDLKKEYIEVAYNYKARALVKMEEFSEALDLFKQYPIPSSNLVKHLHMDSMMRNLSKSYEAICWLKMNNREKAAQLAEVGTKELQFSPQSPYYKHAEKVLNEVRVLQMSGTV